MNIVTLIGRVTKDCELKVLNNANQTNVIKFTLAVERDYKDKNGAKIVDFLAVEYMGKNLTKLASFITKGRQLGINGSINVDKVNNSYFTKIKANKIELIGTNGAKEEDSVTKSSNVGPHFDIIEDDDTPF